MENFRAGDFGGPPILQLLKDDKFNETMFGLEDAWLPFEGIVRSVFWECACK